MRFDDSRTTNADAASMREDVDPIGGGHMDAFHAGCPPEAPGETDTPKWRYSFYVWPDETWGSDYMPGTQEIPSAVFTLFRQWNARIEVQMTALEFVRYRHDLGTFGLTLREITRGDTCQECGGNTL